MRMCSNVHAVQCTAQACSFDRARDSLDILNTDVGGDDVLLRRAVCSTCVLLLLQLRAPSCSAYTQRASLRQPADVVILSTFGSGRARDR